jgi:hypothetical protein
VTRGADVERLAELVGEDVLRVTDKASGWPALAELSVEGVSVPVALFVAPVGLSHRGRDKVERRFQNPGGNRPIIDPRPSREPLLIGLWEADEQTQVERPLLVSADPFKRLGLTTRFSVFVSMASLRAALETGWFAAENAVGESIRCFTPSLLGLSYQADRDAVPDMPAMQAAIAGSGLLDAPASEIPAASERARRAGSTLVRDARFSRRVVSAYDGLCAMCGLDLELVQGAHIYPVSAPGSHDEPWNGLALCANHHLAFDRHLVGVVPATSDIAFHRTIRDQVSGSPAVRALVGGTFPRLESPADPAAQPRSEMFEWRYDYFPGRYEWLVR